MVTPDDRAARWRTSLAAVRAMLVAEFHATTELGAPVERQRHLGQLLIGYQAAALLELARDADA